MQRLITASVAVTTLLAALSSIASAAPPASATTPPVPAAVTPVMARAIKKTRDDSRGGVSRIAIPPLDRSAIVRTFHPDYSHALTPDQMNASWEAEIDRVFETPITGGG